MRKKSTKTKRGFFGEVKPGRYQLVGGLAFTGRKDTRWAEYKKVQKETGVSPDETWNLDVCFGMFMAPRVRMYKELTIGCPGYLKGGMDEWYEILDQIAEGLEMLGRGEPDIGDPDWKEKQAKVDKALKLFAKYIRGMWW